MKRSFLILLGYISVMVLSCSGDDVSGSGNLVSENRSVSNFASVSLEGTLKATIQQGDEQGVYLIADDNVMQHVKTEVEDGMLKIFLESGFDYKNIDLVVDVTSEHLLGVKNKGSSTIEVVAGDDNELFYVTNEGSGTIEFSGVSHNLYIKNEGSGKLSGFSFTASDCTVETIGSGDIELICLEALDARIEGSGNLFYKGFPTITTDIVGSGRVVNQN